MKVTVNHIAALKPDVERGQRTIQLAPGDTVKDLLSKIGVEESNVGILMVSGKQATFDQQLKDNDRVTIIPPIGGG
jgi:sulfur carrier protein ThiS